MNKRNSYLPNSSASVGASSEIESHNRKSKHSSALPTFLKWFKKSDNRKSRTASNGGISSVGSVYSSSQESISGRFNSSQDIQSHSSSSDSIVSTATTGFAFVPAKNYLSENQNAHRANNAAALENRLETDSMLRRIRLHNLRTSSPNKNNKVKISLKDKYCLYESDTLKSSHPTAYDNYEFSDCSLPNFKSPQTQTLNNKLRTRNRQSRRTVSDSSKDRKAGAYSHVKGKRRAPLPPTMDTATNNGLTLGRKKRRAPPPPSIVLPNESETKSQISRGISLDETPSSPTPRPWYKRPNSTNRDSSIPFKREVILKTMDKRKSKHKEKMDVVVTGNQLPECGYSRSSIFDSSNKLGCLFKSKDNEKKSDDKDTKRRSGISIPNISELDREAAEIVHKSQESRSAEKLPDHLILQQQMFDTKVTSKAKDTTSNSDPTDDLKLTELTWSCPFCTLTNPSWRIICEVCEKLKPFDKMATSNDLIKSNEKPQSGQMDNFNNKIVKSKISDKNLTEEFKLTNNHWEKKTEQVLKYFPSHYQSEQKMQNQLPRGSPKLDVKVQNTQNMVADQKKLPLVDSSAIVTTVTPVFYAEETLQQGPSTLQQTSADKDDEVNVEEIRQARLSKFAIEPPKEEQPLNDDPKSLDRERRRLREKIRSMNAQALTEKYPVLKKDPSVEENDEAGEPAPAPEPTSPSPAKPQNLGAIKKVFATKPNNISIDDAKPKKVSSSAQTSRVVKKQFAVEEHELSDRSSSPPDETRQITQLKSVHNDLTEFKEAFQTPLRETSYNISKTDTVTLNKIMRNLEMAISGGEYELAANLAMDLAKMKVSLQVTKTRSSPSSKDTDSDAETNGSFSVKVIRNDKKSTKEMSIHPKMTVSELKKKAFKEFAVPTNAQRWSVEANVLFDDKRTLSEYGINDNKTALHLYTIDAPLRQALPAKSKIPVTSKALPEDDYLSDTSSSEAAHNAEIVNGAAALPLERTGRSWPCPLCTLINDADALACSACTKPRPSFFKGESTKVILRPQEKRNDLNKTSPNRKSSEMFNIVEEKPRVISAIKKDDRKAILAIPSPNITKNKYRGVDNFNPSLIETITVTNNFKSSKTETPLSAKNEKKDIVLPTPYTKDHYMELLKLDTSDVVPNLEAFECTVCFAEAKPREGVVLRECLHSFCRECLSNTIKYSEEAVVKCPFMDAAYSCDCLLQEREIRALVSAELYEKHLAKSLREAQHNIENAYHCKTPNCRGWCIYEDNVNQFKCPVCKILNCLTCRIIHDGLTCKQYQDRLNSDCDSNTEAKRTIEMLKEMVEKGEAMNCPTCQVIMMKKWGCDWLKCSMCKTEVCWVTRGPRWGPAGKGDTSGGCKCGVDGKKCHAMCNYCH